MSLPQTRITISVKHHNSMGDTYKQISFQQTRIPISAKHYNSMGDQKTKPWLTLTFTKETHDFSCLPMIFKKLLLTLLKSNIC